MTTRKGVSLISVRELEQLDLPDFLAALDGIFEHSPWVAARAWSLRPFGRRDTLLDALCRCMREASRAEQMQLVGAHPELAGKAAIRGELTKESSSEQASAGLDACSPEEFERMQTLNAAYRAKFGFPFIIAVRGLTRVDILAKLARRLENDEATEFDEALRQIERIAGLRLADRVKDE